MKYYNFHEERIPEDLGHLRNTRDSIVSDRNHHLIAREVEGKFVHYKDNEKVSPLVIQLYWTNNIMQGVRCR